MTLTLTLSSVLLYYNIPISLPEYQIVTFLWRLTCETDQHMRTLCMELLVTILCEFSHTVCIKFEVALSVHPYHPFVLA